MLIVIAFFGVTRLPQIGKMLGRRARLAQHAVGETKDALKEGYDESGPVVDAEVVDEPSGGGPTRNGSGLRPRRMRATMRFVTTVPMQQLPLEVNEDGRSPAPHARAFAPRRCSAGRLAAR